MSKPRQTTLFQTWGYEGNRPMTSTTNSTTDFNNQANLDDEKDDELLLRALELSRAEFESSQSEDLKDLPGFDSEAGRTWIYPVNFEERSYQFTIVKSCLFRNTLVALPTGLGKTFIAAVVMYNFFRWFPGAKLVFMAPTKPLVAQQIEACFNIMGIPQVETMEMTGNVSVKLREKAWKQKRVLFMTPQVMSNDLSRGLFPAQEVKLLVVDEAHRAQGDYAYCQVVREMQRCQCKFRVIALSATPGKDIMAVRTMLQNLMISHIELRSEESPDIVPYTFQRQIEKIVVPLGDELQVVRMKYASILENFIGRLARNGVLAKQHNSSNPFQYSKFGLLQCRNEFRQNPPQNLNNYKRGLVESDFACSITLYHANELLQTQSMRAFYNFMKKSIADEGGNHKLKHALNQLTVWNEIYNQLEEKFADDSNNSRLNSSAPKILSNFSQGSQEVEDIVLGHPKLERLRDMVLEHFRKKQAENEATRVMIFSEYRDSVREITACLHAYKPLIKVMEFVGQAGVKGKKGLTQKAQIEVVKRFREGGFNTLVSTCVGEEGLDIGEVDLIVCYDVPKSPVRLVQRMGRTGRKRAGRIIVLVTEGKEENIYNKCLYSKKSINKALMDKDKLSIYLVPSPNLFPEGFKPGCLRMEMIQQKFQQSKNNEKALAPDNNRRISGMLKGKKRKSGNENKEPKKKKRKVEKVADAQIHEVIDLEMEEVPNELSEVDLEVLQYIENEMSTQIEEKKLKHEDEVKKPVEFEDAEEDRVPSWLMDDEVDKPLRIRPLPEYFKDPSSFKVSSEEIANFDFKGAFQRALERRKCQNMNFDDFEFDISDMGHHSPIRPVPGIQKSTPQQPMSRQTSTPKASTKLLPKSTPTLSPFPVIQCQNKEERVSNSTLEMVLNDDWQDKTDNDVEIEMEKQLNETITKAKVSKDVSLYTATQLTSMLQKETGNDSELANSEDLFRTEDDEFFLNIEEKENGSAFKLPDLNAFEETRAKQSTTPVAKMLLHDETSSPMLANRKRKAFTGLQFSSPEEEEDPSSSPSVVKHKKRKVAFNFFEHEADVSADADISSDENEDNLNAYDESFVDDASQGVSGTQKERYLQSTKSPSRQRPPTRPLRPITANIFTQGVNDALGDDYEEDSFCVDSSHVEYDSRLDTLDCIDEGLEETCVVTKEKSKGKKKRTVVKACMSSSEEEVSPKASSVIKKDPSEIEREARLKKQKQLTEQFRKKMLEKQKAETESSTEKKKIVEESSSSNSLSENPLRVTSKKLSTSEPSTSHSATNITKAEDKNSGKNVIFVSSCEVHKVAELISDLKHDFGISICVRYLKGAGYLVSSRMAVERMMLGEFTNASNRQNIIQRCQAMNDYFERPFIVLESDKPSEDGVIPRSIHNQGHLRTKYVDAIFSQLTESKISVCYTDNQNQSAAVIAALHKKESDKGFGLLDTKHLSVKEENVLKFYQAMPGVSLGLALLMVSKFSSPKGLASASVATIMSRLNVDQTKALKMFNLLRQRFLL